MAERGVEGRTEEEKDVESGEETAAQLSITLCSRERNNVTAVHPRLRTPGVEDQSDGH